MLNKKRQELIIQNLRSISAEVRCMSIEQLVNLPGMPAEEKIVYLEKVLQDQDETVRTQAVSAISRLGGGTDSPVSAVVKPVSASAPFKPVDLAATPSEVVSDISLPPLTDLPKSAVLPPLPTKPSFATPPAAVSPVMPTEPPSSPAPIEKSVTKPSQPAELNESLDPSLPDLKKMTDISAMLQHIKFLASQKPAGHVTQLLQLSRSMLEEVALTALQSLFNLKDSRVPPHIMSMLADEQYSSQRRFLMLKIIMDTEVDLDPATLESILLKERDVIVKSGLVKVFARSSRAEGIPTLVRCLQDEDPRVRANTVEVIEEQNIRGCEQQIIQLLEDPENRVKVNAAKYLVKNGYQQAFMTLRAMLVSPEVWLRDSVIFALGEIGDQPSLTLLKAALKDPNQGIRLSVLKALARINNNTSRQVLKAACNDPDPVVAQVAGSLFEKIKDTPMREELKSAAVRPVEPVAPAAAAAPVARATPAKPSIPAMSDLSAMPTTPLPAVAPVAPVAPVKPEVVAPAPVLPEMPAMPVAPASTPARPIVPPLSVSQKAPAPRPPVGPAVPGVAGMPAFARPRSAEIYAKLCSDNLDEQRAAARDIAFVMGDDQMILIDRAAGLADESIRIAAVKLLSRKKTPDAIELLKKLTTDSNETVRSLAEKALQLQK